MHSLDLRKYYISAHTSCSPDVISRFARNYVRYAYVISRFARNYVRYAYVISRFARNYVRYAYVISRFARNYVRYAYVISRFARNYVRYAYVISRFARNYNASDKVWVLVIYIVVILILRYHQVSFENFIARREVTFMIRGLESLNLFTENAKRLVAFYRDKVGLKIAFEGEMGEDYEIYEMALGKGPNLYIINHSKVKGKNKNPEMIIFNLEVDDIKKEVARLARAKVKQIQPTYHIEGYGWISTFADVDGNFFQLVQVRPTPNKES